MRLNVLNIASLCILFTVTAASARTVTEVNAYIQAKNYERAEQSAQQLTLIDPEYVQGWLLLGYCQTQNQRFGASNTSYERALETGAERREVFMRKAYNYIKLKDYSSARRSYRRVLEDNAEDFEALQKLGYLEGKLRNYDDASYYYRQALDLQPENKNIIQALAKVEAANGGGSEARRLLEKTIEFSPDDTEALGKLAVICIREKDYEAAIKPLTQLIALEPANAAAYRNLGIAYYQTQHKSDARTAFEVVRSSDGNMKGLYGPLADCYIAAGSYAQATTVIRQGIEAGDSRGWLYAMWGKALEGQGDYDGAILKFERSIAMGEAPWNDYAHKQIARQEQLKQRQRAMAAQQGLN